MTSATLSLVASSHSTATLRAAASSKDGVPPDAHHAEGEAHRQHGRTPHRSLHRGSSMRSAPADALTAGLVAGDDRTWLTIDEGSP
jgi:hypothetical protein